MTEVAAVIHLEKRVDSFVESVNKRLDSNNAKLDMLIDLARLMAVLQEKQDHNSEDIKAFGEKIKEHDTVIQADIRKTEAKFDASVEERKLAINRLHKRIDELERYQVDKYKEIAEQASACALGIKQDIATLNDKHVSLKEDYSSKVNYIRGGLAVLGAFTLIGQGILYKYFDDFDKSIAEGRVHFQKIENRFHETERMMDIIQRESKEKRK
jgi:hypothetical protein